MIRETDLLEKKKVPSTCNGLGSKDCNGFQKKDVEHLVFGHYSNKMMRSILQNGVSVVDTSNIFVKLVNENPI